MINTPLFVIIQGLGKRERADLLKWVQSPAINRRPEVVRLCACLYDCLPAEQVDKQAVVDKPRLFNDIFELQGKIVNGRLSVKQDASLRYTISYLYAAVQQWLAWKEWSADPVQVGLHLCSALRKRGRSDLAESQQKNLRQNLKNVRQSTDFLRVQYQIQFENWAIQHRSGHAEAKHMEAVCGSFGAFVALSALRHGCALLDQPKSGFSIAQVDYLPETLGLITAGKYTEIPAVQVYFHCFRLMETQSERHFSALKTLLFSQTNLFPPEEIRDVWLVAINYCIRRLNAGEREWVREAFGLYRSSLEGGVILDHGRLSKATYQNIMLLAIASDEWDWARQFLEDYRPALSAGERYNAYAFNLALWHFRRQEYPVAQAILRDVEFRDVYYNLDARRMLVRMYFDQGAFNALDALLHSFQIYLQRHRNISYHRDMSLHFVRYVRKIIQLKPNDKVAKNRLRERIRQEQYLAERDWLLLKLE